MRVRTEPVLAGGGLSGDLPPVRILAASPKWSSAMAKSALSPLTACLLTLMLQSVGSDAADWPQWRGPDRTHVSRETGLLRSWPKEGPPLAWKVDGLGTGAVSLSVAGGRVYSLGYRKDGEYLTALDEATGKLVWTRLIGPGVKEAAGMQWLSQRSPTVDRDRVYAMSALGTLVCLDTAAGKELWRKSYPDDFGGKRG